MLANCCNSDEAIAAISGTTVTWTSTGSGKADPNGEEGWSNLPGGDVLTVDATKVKRTGNCKKKNDHVGTAALGCLTWLYFPANSFFTMSLTTFPSTRIPDAANLAIAFFITVPISFMVGEPISAIVAFTPAAISDSLAALGR